MLTQRYPEPFIAPMREELTRVGFEELRTAGAVDEAVARPGTTLVVVNSVCGCAAGKARPGIALSLRNGARPDHLTTVFAGGDIEATERARSYFAPYAPGDRRAPSEGVRPVLRLARVAPADLLGNNRDYGHAR